MFSNTLGSQLPLMRNLVFCVWVLIDKKLSCQGVVRYQHRDEMKYPNNGAQFNKCRLKTAAIIEHLANNSAQTMTCCFYCINIPDKF